MESHGSDLKTSANLRTRPYGGFGKMGSVPKSPKKQASTSWGIRWTQRHFICMEDYIGDLNVLVILFLSHQRCLWFDILSPSHEEEVKTPSYQIMRP